MSQNFQAGDFLIFQLESGYGLLRILAIDKTQMIRFVACGGLHELFLDIEMADSATLESAELDRHIPHVALTNRRFWKHAGCQNEKRIFDGGWIWSLLKNGKPIPAAKFPTVRFV